MLSWQSLQYYLQFDRRWYETAERHRPAPAHLAAFRELVPDGWATRRRGLWFIADPPGRNTPAQGWKLHVTAAAGESEEVLRLALPVLFAHNVAFKFLIDPWSVELTSGKTFSRTASGKFITVYPADDAEFHAVGKELAEALEGRTGPYILSDRRWPGSTAVYYRYGGFAAIKRLRADGINDLMIATPDGTLVPDVRNPYFETPPWVTDPFPPEQAEEEEALNGRYVVTGALMFGNRGGVYLATDRETDAQVVLKEARPGVLVGRPGRAATEVLEKEYQVLSELADTGYYVKPLDFFHEAGHAFLVEEYVDGPHYSRNCIATNPVITGKLDGESLRTYYRTQRALWRQIAEAVAAAHRRGILLGDLSYTNVHITKDGRAVLLDLEAAVREGIDPHLGVHTIGLASPRLRATNRYDRANDWHCLGALIFSSVMVVNNTIGFHRPAQERFLDALTEDLALPAELASLIRDLTDPEAVDGDFDPDELLKRIDALPFDDPALWASPVPLTEPADRRYRDHEALPGLRDADLAATVEGIAAEIEAAADAQRADRLFPSNPLVHQTNPLSLAYGATGILYGLHRLRGSVPDRLLGWALAKDVDPAAYPPGLYLGQSGLAWAFDALGHPAVARALMASARRHPLRNALPGILHGTAGHGLAALHLWHRQHDPELLADAVADGEHLAATAVHGPDGPHWPQPIVGDDRLHTRLGHGHGGSGIALFLLYLHLATGEERWYTLGRAALGHDLAHAATLPGGTLGFPSRTGPAEGRTILRNYWDEGTAGVSVAVVRYLTVRPDDEQLAAVTEDLLRDSARRYAVFPHLAHGLAGLGNVLLDAGELLGEQRWLDEARRVADGILLSRIEQDGEIPGGIGFPGEQALRESCDLATGSIGVALFLDRLRLARPGTRTDFHFTVDGLLP
ncbi:class III lanthionine synthetase LanKC [Kitasatospora sp. NPDC048407]|uniref:class III lanthionine synthetase LanKC n=1 Tax=Kitasatospora sp. NPDC048407 TaxID=3364051 RepID=UPI0037207C6E